MLDSISIQKPWFFMQYLEFSCWGCNLRSKTEQGKTNSMALLSNAIFMFCLLYVSRCGLFLNTSQVKFCTCIIQLCKLFLANSKSYLINRISRINFYVVAFFLLERKHYLISSCQPNSNRHDEQATGSRCPANFTKPLNSHDPIDNSPY